MKEETKTKEGATVKKAEKPKGVTEVKKAADPPLEKGMPEWLSPILSALGGMGGSYLLWLRPLQAKVELLSESVKQTEEELKELKRGYRELERKHQALKETAEDGLKGFKEKEEKEKYLIHTKQTQRNPEESDEEEEEEDNLPRTKNTWRYKRKNGIALLK